MKWRYAISLLTLIKQFHQSNQDALMLSFSTYLQVLLALYKLLLGSALTFFHRTACLSHREDYLHEKGIRQVMNVDTTNECILSIIINILEGRNESDNLSPDSSCMNIVTGDSVRILVARTSSSWALLAIPQNCIVDETSNRRLWYLEIRFIIYKMRDDHLWV